MKDPGSMSLTAILVLTVVVLVLMGGWLGAIFFVARQGRGGRLDEEAPGHANRPEAGAHSRAVPTGDGGTGDLRAGVGRAW